MLKARAGFELMSYSTVVNSLTNCAKLLDGIFGYLKKKSYLILLFILINNTSKHGGIKCHFKVYQIEIN